MVPVVAVRTEARRFNDGSPGTCCLEDLEDVVGDERQATLKMVVLQARRHTDTAVCDLRSLWNRLSYKSSVDCCPASPFGLGRL